MPDESHMLSCITLGHGINTCTEGRIRQRLFHRSYLCAMPGQAVEDSVHPCPVKPQKTRCMALSKQQVQEIVHNVCARCTIMSMVR
jgi:hypothetical protein